MSYDVRFSPRASNDIDSIWDVVYSVSLSYDVADDYIDGIIETIEDQREFPRSGAPLTYRGLFTGFYSVLYKKYLVFYRVRDDHIEVARILLASSDYIKVLFGDLPDA